MTAALPTGRTHKCRSIVLASLLLTLATLHAAVATAHGPDPTLSGSLWASNQSLGYDWLSGQVPPSQLQSAIVAAATDVTNTRLSKAATFSHVTGAASWINYGSSICNDTTGLACFSRANAPSSFHMSFRVQGYQFTWGNMDWCQFHSTFPNGCYDAEMVAVDEFGHVEILNHHVNYTNNSDYLDAAVQTYSHTKPNVGWNVHTLEKCDQASLQVKYGMLSSSGTVPNCFQTITSHGTYGLVVDLSASPTSTTVCANQSVTISGRLNIHDYSSYGMLGAQGLASRTIWIDRGSTSKYTSAATGSGSGNNWSKAFTGSNATFTYVAHFDRPSSEGLDASPQRSFTITWLSPQVAC